MNKQFSKYSKRMQKAIINAVAYMVKNPKASAYNISRETGVTQYIARKLIRERQTPVENLKAEQEWRLATPEKALFALADEQVEAARDVLENLDAAKQKEVMDDIEKGLRPGVKMLLDAAAVFDERGKTYGPAASHWRDVANVWSGIAGTVIPADTAIKMMIALKLLRLKETPNHRDTIIDIAGYAAVLAEVVGGDS